MRRHRISRIRGLVAALIVLSVAVGLALHTGTGTLSAIGIGSVAAVCPLGALEALLGSHAFMVHPLILIGVTAAVTLLVGKAFCSWACPVSYIHGFFHSSKRHAPAPDEPGNAVDTPGTTADDLRNAVDTPETVVAMHPGTPLPAVGGRRDGIRFDSRHVVLIGALIAALMFGFPVFCLICPVGLTFATIIALWQLVQFNEATWGLLVFPALIALEVVVFGRWCHTLCPQGVLLSLISTGNRTLRPHVDREICLRSHGVDCHACVDICPEEVDPHAGFLPDCSKCGRCADLCPREAISFPFIVSGADGTPKHPSETSERGDE